MWNCKAVLATLFILCFPFVVRSNDVAACNAPLLTAIDSITTSSFVIKWTDFNAESQGWEIEYGPRGFSQSFQSSVGVITSKSIKITELSSGKAYDIYLKSICNDEESNWNGPFLIRTAIKNNEACNLQLEITDNNCPRKEDFYIKEDRFSGLVLGKDVFIQSVDLIIEHDWPADIQIELTNPSGKSVILAANKGIGLDNFGNPLDTLCNQVCSFSDFACNSIDNANGASLIGSFLPEEPLGNLYDGSLVNGLWRLRMCDRAFEDKGILKKVYINFSPEECNVPTRIAAVNIDKSTAEIIWSAPEKCDVSIIHLVNTGMEPGSGLEIFTPCQTGSFILKDLQPETIYDVYIQSGCAGVESAFSCPFTFTTACDSITLASSFDNIPICEATCLSACEIQDSIWVNNINEDMQDWIVYNGSTPTDLTGPPSDISGTGNYIYHESSPELCGPSSSAILETKCIFIGESSEECGMSFYYYMRGEDIGSLTLTIKTFEDIWDTLFYVENNQENNWVREFVDLRNFKQTYATLRFIARSETGELSDIAIDQIEFYSSSLQKELPRFYFDFDQDGYGTPDSIISLCINDPPSHFVRNGEDCDDANSNINPGRIESGCNAIDDDCNGRVDDVQFENQIKAHLVGLTNESCPGLADGRIEISVAGGSPPYEINWNTGFKGLILDGISDGVYFAEITDSDQCKLRTSFYDVDIENSPNIFIRNITNTACGQSIGSISIDVAGGTPPYSFLWSNGSIEKNNTNLAEGSYSVQVNDANGCIVESARIEVIATPRFTSGVQLKRDLKCFGDNNGMISVGVINALEPVQYIWNTGDTTATIRNLSAGMYSVTINDGRGCDGTLSIPIGAPSKLKTIVVGIEQVSCADGADGSIQISTIGGSTPYNFNWLSVVGNQISSPNNEDIGSLRKGDYFLIVNDKNGCKDTSETVTIIDPEPINISVVDIKNVKCRFSDNGSIQVVASGGNEGFQYFWNSGDRGEKLTNVKSGTYSIRVIDQLGCKAGNNALEVAIQNVPLTIDHKILNLNICSYDSNGVIMAQITSNSKLPVDYNWSNGTQSIKNAKSDTIIGLSSGNYSLTATDNEGCVGEISKIVIPQVPILSLDTILKIGNVCRYDSNGSIQLQISGGTPPYSYVWNDGATNKNRNKLISDTYIVEISDVNGCKLSSDSIVLPSIFDLNVDVKITNSSTDQNNGRISLNISEGIPPYNISWDAVSESSSEISNLAPGFYCVDISDSQGCNYYNCFEIKNSTSTADRPLSSINIFPNPATEYIFLESQFKIETIKIISIEGKLAASVNLNSNNNKVNINELTSGLYILIIRTRNGTYYKKFLKL
jgi:subtilisin-like proprotein convertase family protein